MLTSLLCLSILFDPYRSASAKQKIDPKTVGESLRLLPGVPGRIIKWNERVHEKMTLFGPSGAEIYYHVKTAFDVQIDVLGPVVLNLAIHALTSTQTTNQTTMQFPPFTIAILVDDVLTKTFTPEVLPSVFYKLENAELVVSTRLYIRIPIADLKHSIRLSISDSATLGILLQPAIEPEDRSSGPILIMPKEDRETSPFIKDDRPEVPYTPAKIPAAKVEQTALPQQKPMPGIYVQTLNLMAGTIWSNKKLGPGATVLCTMVLDGTFLQWHTKIPKALAIGVTSGFFYAGHSRSYLDPHQSSTQTTSFNIQQIPLLIDLRYRLDLPLPFGTRPLAFDVGVGGGTTLLWSQVDNSFIRENSRVHTRPTILSHVTTRFPLGFGEVLLHLAFLGTAKTSTKNIDMENPGGFLLTLGYAIPEPGALIAPYFAHSKHPEDS